MFSSECKTYSVLNDADRAVSSSIGSLKCDINDISKGWYRFMGAAGSAMPTSCITMRHCGTHSPGWLNGNHPSQSEGVVSRTACFSWDKNCCQWKNAISVRNCGGFYVYNLDRPPHCNLRYCGNGQSINPGK